MRTDKFYIKAIGPCLAEFGFDTIELDIVDRLNWNEAKKNLSTFAFYDIEKDLITLNKSMLDKVKKPRVIGILRHELLHRYLHKNSIRYRIKQSIVSGIVKDLILIFHLNEKQRITQWLLKYNAIASHKGIFAAECKKRHIPNPIWWV